MEKASKTDEQGKQCSEMSKRNNKYVTTEIKELQDSFYSTIFEIYVLPNKMNASNTINFSYIPYQFSSQSGSSFIKLITQWKQKQIRFTAQ